MRFQNCNNLIAKITTDPAPKHLAHAEWLGVAQKVDAQDTILEINNSGTPDWLIVDHYGIDSEWERMLRPHVNKIMIIDDIADRKHDCGYFA